MIYRDFLCTKSECQEMIEKVRKEVEALRQHYDEDWDSLNDEIADMEADGNKISITSVTKKYDASGNLVSVTVGVRNETKEEKSYKTFNVQKRGRAMNKQIHEEVLRIEAKGLQNIELLALVTDSSYEVIFMQLTMAKFVRAMIQLKMEFCLWNLQMISMHQWLMQ